MKKSDLLKLLDNLEFHPGKILGQNFLIDDNLLDFIIRSSNPNSGDEVLEVGPGFGVLTRKLLQTGVNLTAIEFDHRLADYLRKNITTDAFELVEADVLRVDIESLMAKKGDFKCIANLPYAVSSPFLANLISLNLPPKYMCFMLQKEVGQRLAAHVGVKNYGGLSVRVQAIYDVKILRTVPKQVFLPPPDVDSAIVQFVRKDTYPAKNEMDKLSKLVKVAFSQRRKQMFKLLANLYGKENIVKLYEVAQLNKTVRAEQLTVEEFISLSNDLTNILD